MVKKKTLISAVSVHFEMVLKYRNKPKEVIIFFRKKYRNRTQAICVLVRTERKKNVGQDTLRPNSESKEGICVPGQGFNNNSTHLILV